jgi:hypothetical protein
MEYVRRIGRVVIFLAKAPIAFVAWAGIVTSSVVCAIVGCILLAPASYVATGSMDWFSKGFNNYTTVMHGAETAVFVWIAQ